MAVTQSRSFSITLPPPSLRHPFMQPMGLAKQNSETVDPNHGEPKHADGVIDQLGSGSNKVAVLRV